MERYFNVRGTAYCGNTRVIRPRTEILSGCSMSERQLHLLGFFVGAGPYRCHTHQVVVNGPLVAVITVFVDWEYFHNPLCRLDVSRFGAVGVLPTAEGVTVEAFVFCERRMLLRSHPSMAQDPNQMVGMLPPCCESTTMSLCWIGPMRFARQAQLGL
jgi:hypothetical protein